jgi:hypothetical protein
VIALMWRFEELKTPVTNNLTEASLIMLLAMIFAALVFEDFGSRWEGWLDAREDKRNVNSKPTQHNSKRERSERAALHGVSVSYRLAAVRAAATAV